MHATIPKGNMGYDQFTVPDTVAFEPVGCSSKKFERMAREAMDVRLRVLLKGKQQKTPSCTMELKSNVSLNQAWLQYRARFGSYSLSLQ